MKLSLGFSPCPNDTFIFDALIHHKVDTEGLEFDVLYEDVETLNQRAFLGELAITKLSYHAYAYAVEDYVLLNAGSALGFGVGPLLICKDPELAAQLSTDAQSPTVAGLKIGIPGKYTTANFLLGLAFPELENKQEMVFSAIEQALLDGTIDLGLIIHENRFTYESKGLHKIVDLGDYWEKATHSPIPLGGIVAKRDLSEETKHKIDRVIRRSVEFALKNPKSGVDFIRSHAQEMSETVMYNHIELYVNRFSVSLGDEGRSAIHTLFERAWALGVVPKTSKPLFL
ncbi:1,4-dihydroxy-6-naphtoate synthase [Parapedobacter pyrenivorans]|uniref:1,4-dihydroxy-6-naphtoate synthase n=1 Tax=Parapedobacter pyrenivorans TaxID=1305674 RepID=A0A917I194_9SPHI|nr:1,4-dihydroxy-6-naphthoate synthase [Parapedobacter pyrenivorans]GGH01164.1 1,4-dihydroxy-6-naphtoate synthase [Parapedobacter pyrenivorans]